MVLDKLMEIFVLDICDIFIIDHVSDNISRFSSVEDGVGCFQAMGVPCVNNLQDGDVIPLCIPGACTLLSGQTWHELA